ncbi:hypothetical protein CC80DRAFT_545267 [Byssothecium circinans]|uniref:Uncharacterized protein n=1 Tax=Byssothecium circinans TaxID=147558 RepID=A0A6A5UFG6_9PLEO|nr:hypothetical protein CC80DRAFT_545267 [Byssothecium circinans]
MSSRNTTSLIALGAGAIHLVGEDINRSGNAHDFSFPQGVAATIEEEEDVKIKIKIEENDIDIKIEDIPLFEDDKPSDSDSDADAEPDIKIEEIPLIKIEGLSDWEPYITHEFVNYDAFALADDEFPPDTIYAPFAGMPLPASLSPSPSSPLPPIKNEAQPPSTPRSLRRPPTGSQNEIRWDAYATLLQRKVDYTPLIAKNEGVMYRVGTAEVDAGLRRDMKDSMGSARERSGVRREVMEVRRAMGLRDRRVYL